MPSWIWTEAEVPARNAFVRFRRVFAGTGGRLVIRISADARYWIHVNGEYLGTGPVRSWPRHWKYDEYEVPSAALRSRNVVAVLVNRLGEGNFQYIPANPGLWVDIRAKGARVGTDASWRCSPSAAHLSRTPRISVQEGFEEQFDARRDDGWTAPGYEDSRWPQAAVVPAPHGALRPRGIPLLTRDLVLPARVVRAERIRPASQTWNLALKAYFAPDDPTSNGCFVKAFVFSQVWSRTAQTVSFIRPHHHASAFKVNGKALPAIATHMITPLVRQPVRLRAGWNQVLFPYPGLAESGDGVVPGVPAHFPHFVLAVCAGRPLRWAARGKAGGAPWALVGPFAFTPREEEATRQFRDAPHVVLQREPHPAATAAAFAALYGRGTLDAGVLGAPYFQELSSAHTVTTDVAAGAMADEPDGPHSVANADALLSDNAEWAVIPPAGAGTDVRVLLDFGRELLGHHVLEVEAESGTVIDFHNFEFIQADGGENYADGMNNALRYVCREGRQSLRSLQRRGFQYSWLIVRGLRRPLRLRRVAVEFTTYPQARVGGFACSDALLNRIWETGAHTLRCCSEDTYTDCPTYEQTHWVGDARNEALIDWVINGDRRLWFRCLEQVGQSLERSPLTLSNVPSAWTDVLPAWSALWMRSCREYLLWTGDATGAARLLKWVERNVDGIEGHLNADGLFEIQAWNMFDWAEMDTPDRGVITHNNCFMVLALRDCAELASWLGRPATARRFRSLATRLARAVNRRLWDRGRRAYVDSIHADGVVSGVFSQQTQTVALMAGVAAGARGRRCREIVHRPPDGFVKAGSPFFEFFLLEVLATEGRTERFLDVIRSDWGFMIEQGATTFWEMWSNKTGRLTRSHCHGWSAAPTFFLSTEILGVRPVRPGFAEVTVAPKLGRLRFIRGSVPTPRGPITVSCERRGGKVRTAVTLPPGVKLRKTSR
jgi:hypothetical protein